MRARFSRPPAAVMSLAAKAAPKRADRLGARPDLGKGRRRQTDKRQANQMKRNAKAHPAL